MQQSFQHWLDGVRSRQLSQLRQDAMRAVRSAMDEPTDEGPSSRLRHELLKLLA